MKLQAKFDWREAAMQLATAIPRERLHPAVLAWADSSGARRTWGLAFSGGADSLALLLLLWAHWPRNRRRMLVLHFDHGLRGTASRADAVFCRKVCLRLGVRFKAGKWARPSQAPNAEMIEATRGAPRPVVSEAAARAARHAFLGRHARVIWFGHQMDDIAESMLMRLARGSGSAGLAAPRPVQAVKGGRINLRPLLTLKKAELVAALQSTGVPWCEDASNVARDFFRNRVRHEVIPHWADAARRDALAGAARSRALLEEDDAALEAWAHELQAVDRDGVLVLGILTKKPRAVMRRVLHRWLLAQPGAGELSSQAFEMLLAAVESGKSTRHSLGRDCFAVLRRGELRFESAGKSRGAFRGCAN